MNTMLGRLRMTPLIAFIVVAISFSDGAPVTPVAVSVGRIEHISTTLAPALPPGYVPHCTNAPGPAGAAPFECIDVDGSGPQNDRVKSTYYYHTPAALVTATVCERHHEVAYYSSGKRKTAAIDPSSCLNGPTVLGTGDYVTFTIPGRVDRNQPVCVRAKNSATSGAWTSYACLPGSSLG